MCTGRRTCGVSCCKCERAKHRQNLHAADILPTGSYIFLVETSDALHHLSLLSPFRPQYDYRGYASCTHVCRYPDSGSGCNYCCVCSNSYTMARTGSCDQCVLPAAPTGAMISPPSITTGVDTYLYSCREGYWGRAVSRTCSRTNGAWSGSAIVCTSCASTPGIPAKPPSNGTLNTAGSTTTVQCNAGFYNADGSSILTYSCNSTAGSFTTVGTPPLTTCRPCNGPSGGSGGHYCTGVNDRTPCPAGRYGLDAVPLESAACTGSCLEGM